jgi:uncharacterized membrane protein
VSQDPAPERASQPPGETGQHERRALDSSERLVVFVDAVVAIALTLLVLPLVELVPEGVRGTPPLGELLRENRDRLGSFLLSFLVIFQFWWAHHQLFRHVSRVRRSVVTLTLLWTLSIVFLPVPTAIITAYTPGPGPIALYIGTLLVTSGSLTLLTLTAYRHPELSEGRVPVDRDELLGSTTATLTLVLALVVGTVFAHSIGYFALLLMFLSNPVERLVKRRWRQAGAPA